MFMKNKINEPMDLNDLYTIISEQTFNENKIENTFIYLLDNHSHNDENSITTAIEGYKNKNNRNQ